jgi:hypothetical protein
MAGTATAQLPGAIIDVNGNVYAEADGQKVGVARLLLIFSPDDTVRTDVDGRYEIRLPDFGKPIKVAIAPSDFDIIVPPQGEIHFENLHPSKLSITCNIMVMGDQVNEELMKEIANLNANVGRLKQNNDLSERKVMALRNAMMDTVLYYQRVQANMQNTISQQSREITQLRDSIAVILKKYYQAMDEKFLKQQETFKSISEKLNTFTSRAADLRDWMPNVKLCFERNDAAQQYAGLIKDYNEIRDRINAEHESDLSAVKHYWSNAETAAQLQETYDYLLDQVHDDTYLLWIRKINDHFKAPVRPSQAQKVADNAQVLMAQKLEVLERQSALIIELMRDQI